MKIFPIHTQALMEFGYTEEESRFLYLVATHSGSFTCQQFLKFIQAKPGKRSIVFARKVTEKKHARSKEYLRNGRVFHIFSRNLYEAIGRENVRFRRVHSTEYVRTVRRHIYNGSIDTPKTPRSIRNLPMPRWLGEKLLKHRHRTHGCPNNYLFEGTSGKPLNPVSMCQRVLQPALSALGLPRVSWHCFRRTLATWLSERGTQIKTTQELLGHSSVTTTLDYYVQSLTESRKQAIDQIGRLMDPNGPQLTVPAGQLVQ